MDDNTPQKATSKLALWIGFGCLGAILLLGGCIVSCGAMIFSMMRGSDAYQTGMRLAQEHPAVIEQLGEPMQAGWFITGNIDVSGSSGNADLAIPISGPHGQGTLYIIGQKAAGTWEYQTVTFVGPDQVRIDLLSDDTD